MGWFWTEKNATVPSLSQAPHPFPADSSKPPPPGCPMHKVGDTSNSASPFAASKSLSSSSSPSSSGGCPVKHDTKPSSSSPSSSLPLGSTHGCPVNHESSSSSPSSSSKPSGLLGALNPLNYMPASLSNTRAEGQWRSLPTEREISSIPRGDVESNWEYPSPQQMYNAMVRKRPDAKDAPAIDAVESMVAVHNFLNEGAWNEIEAWEARFSRGLGFGWRTCRSGEQGFEREYRRASVEPGFANAPAPRLHRFIGRPQDLTPKVRIFQALGLVAPSYAGDLPFDRHDWFVQRRAPDGATKEVRYVIDYYSAPPEPTGEPVFYLDVRPAIDGPTAAVERLMRWGGDVWYKASGASTRE